MVDYLIFTKNFESHGYITELGPWFQTVVLNPKNHPDNHWSLFLFLGLLIGLLGS